MSGTLCLVNLDGQPVSPELLRRMTNSMAFRGPDAQELQIDGNVGLGHAMFRTTFESEHESQPFTLDGKVWITADARIDGRSDLIGLLESAGCGKFSNPTDPELILHAWKVWGEDCLDRLIGDFSFAIWDQPNRKLFCARDHFGVKPFYYARTQNCLIVSNTINCILHHPGLTTDLNEQAIGDFLLFGSNEHPETTFYAAINRLPAAHKLTLTGGDLKISRYWTMPIEDEIRYKRQSDYVEHFTELLDSAVKDRLRTDKVAIFMSGGIDSPTIAATAKKILSEQFDKFDFEAFTVVYDRLIPDEERYYSGLVAEKLGMPINYLAADDYKLFEGWDRPEMKTPEPVYDICPIISIDQYHQVDSRFRVCLTGQGGDVILRPSFSHIINLFKNLEFGRAAIEVIRNILQNRRLPRIGFRTRMRKIFGRNAFIDYYPRWLNKDFEARADLRSRWKELTSEQPSIHSYRPEAYRLINAIFWANMFESYDPGNTNFNLEQRHPLFDLRLVNYSMRIPSLPWCVDKRLMRESMADRLPEQILNRAKAPLAGNPLKEKIYRGDTCPDYILSPTGKITRYVDWDSIPVIHMEDVNLNELLLNINPVSLNFWFNHSHQRKDTNE